LSGTKKYFYTHEVAAVNVSRMPNLTVKNVLDKVYAVPEVRIYLPDIEGDPEKRMSREYLFSIVHKIDSTFFRRVVAELEEKQAAVKSLEQPTTMKIRPELLQFLETAAKS